MAQGGGSPQSLKGTPLLMRRIPPPPPANWNNWIINNPINNNKIVKKYRISKSNEINSILYEAHNRCNHCGINLSSMYINIINL